ncbi:MAG: DUF134 domain-containing protein [Candidatus Heimdallarchaeaceae archaeon]
MSNEGNFPRGLGRGKGGGRGMGRGRGRRCRGRPPVRYPVELERQTQEGEGILELSSFEARILELSDIERMTQEQIANELNISQTSVWRYLRQAREKIAKTLLHHKTIKIIIRD